MAFDGGPWPFLSAFGAGALGVLRGTAVAGMDEGDVCSGANLPFAVLDGDGRDGALI